MSATSSRSPPPSGRAGGGRSCGASSPSSCAQATRSSERNCGISGDLPRGAGLSSSAALEVALCIALLELGAGERGGWERGDHDRLEMARLCSRVENEWVGARTGMLDQLACIFGVAGCALLIDFSDLRVPRGPARARGLAPCAARLRRASQPRELRLQRQARGVRERSRATGRRLSRVASAGEADRLPIRSASARYT